MSEDFNVFWRLTRIDSEAGLGYTINSVLSISLVAVDSLQGAVEL